MRGFAVPWGLYIYIAFNKSWLRLWSHSQNISQMKIWSQIYNTTETEIIYLLTYYYIIKSTFQLIHNIQKNSFNNKFVTNHLPIFHSIIRIQFFLPSKFALHFSPEKPCFEIKKNLLNRGLKTIASNIGLNQLSTLSLAISPQADRALRCKLARDTIARQPQTFLL